MRGSRSIAVVLTLVIGVVAAALLGTGSASARVDTSRANPDVVRMPRHCLDGSIIPTVPRRCRIGTVTPGAPTIVLWGDSQAWQFLPALRSATAGQGVNLVAYLLGSCPVIDPRATGTPPARYNACQQLGALALGDIHRMRRHHADVRVVLGQGWELYRDQVTPKDAVDRRYPGYTDAAVRAGARLSVHGTPRAFADLGRWRVPVDVIGQTPRVYVDPPPCRGLRDPDPYRCALPRAAMLKDEASTRSLIQHYRASLTRTGRLIETADDVCGSLQCYAFAHGVPTMFDDNHLGARQTALMAPRFAATVRAVLAAR